jgi:hypothetical protein
MALLRQGRRHGVFQKVAADFPEPSGAPHPMDERNLPIPIPIPWLVDSLVSAVGAGQVASAMPDGPARTQLQNSAAAAIAQILDDYCGTPPRLVPWPWPGPPPWVYGVASELTAIAYTAEGNIRGALLQVAAQVIGAAAPPSNAR